MGIVDLRFIIDGDKKRSALESVKRIKINRIVNPSFLPEKGEAEIIRNVIEGYELAIIGMWDLSGDRSNPDKRDEFNRLCRDCFRLLQVLPMPEEPTLKIQHVLKLLTYSYLGEKWEDMKRILSDDRKIWNLDGMDGGWNAKLLSTIYESILHLARKRDWKDLEDTSKHIGDLRNQQKQFEEGYLDGIEIQYKRGSVYELAALYHLAKIVELVGTYMLQGTPAPVNLTATLSMHFDRSTGYCKRGGHAGLELVLHMLHLTFKKMIENSIWAAARINPKLREFTDHITKSPRPVFEMMYPQRATILENGLLDPAHRAIVVTLPTSSGKTMIAEFKILQALNQFSGQKAWVAYVVPTRALVNQINNRLRNDLGPLGIGVEKMSGALDLDAFETSLLGSHNPFDVLVLTPEKMNLLIRREANDALRSSLVLVIVDEAHNLGNESRGLNLEMLLSIVKNDCEQANFLLLTPMMPNSDRIAGWLDPENSRSISVGLDWKPNDSVVGLYYAEGSRRDVTTYFKPLMYSSEDVSDPESGSITIAKNPDCGHIASRVRKTKYILTSLVSEKLVERGNVLVLSGQVKATWDTAEKISGILPKLGAVDPRITLVQRFIAAELGPDFPLMGHLDHGVGVHNSGLPDEIRQLMEWLMENNLLKVLVSTTTIAQGMNFPASSILLSTYRYSGVGPMPTGDFWNMAGRVGRIDQSAVGLIGIATDGADTKEAIDAMKFVRKSVKEVISVLVKLVDRSAMGGDVIDVESLSYDPAWSNFLQYIAHMYNQSDSLENFISQAEIIVRNTCGYHQMDKTKKSILLEVVKTYADRLDGKNEFSRMSDLTGFSPETVEHTVERLEALRIPETEWSSRLFRPASGTLAKLMGIMMNDIPEIKRDLLEIRPAGTTITNESLGDIVSDWVSGKTIPQIAERHFGGTDVEHIRDCVGTIHGKISTFATWGLSSIQKMSEGMGKFGSSQEERIRMRNLPAMIHYGVDSDEAILMRMNNVPRNVSDHVGKRFLQEHEKSLYRYSSKEIISWLSKLDGKAWRPGTARDISGSDYKEVWKTISGLNQT